MIYSTKGLIILLCTPLAHALWTPFSNFLPKVSQKRQFKNTTFPIESAELGVTVGAATFSAFSALLFWNSLGRALADRSAPYLVDYEDCGELGEKHEDQCWWDCQNWQENKDFKDAMNTPKNYQWPNLPQKSDCYQDCNTTGNVGELPEGSTVTVAEGEFPWMCSLQDAGLSGGHRCGVTLLSGPASQQTVLVGAAQCNLVCRDRERVLDLCCCIQPDHAATCRAETVCTGNPELKKAKPTDLKIVCGELLPISQSETSNEVVLTIIEIINHPDFTLGMRGSAKEGPYGGSDIAVYTVIDSELKAKMKKRKLWPACLPKPESGYLDKRGIWAGWDVPEQLGRFLSEVSFNKEVYRQNILPKQIQVEPVPCRDPEWMESNSFYPAGTICFHDPSYFSSFDYGNSGSGVVRKWAKIKGTYRYAFTGPLSMFKGSDLAWNDLARNGNLETKEGGTITYVASNPGVFTDLRCFLPWVANQYGMRLPTSFQKPSSCDVSHGDREDIDKEVCKGMKFWVPGGFVVKDCDFTFEGAVFGFPFRKYDTCHPYSYLNRDTSDILPNITNSYHFFCVGTDGTFLNCANNCKGVDPNSMAVGGSLLLAASAIGGIGTLLPVLGAGGLAVASVGGLMANSFCPPLMCRALAGMCCLLVSGTTGLPTCPTSC